MNEPIQVHRTEVAQLLSMLKAQGGWEGTHTDFKRELGSKAKDLGKLLKHILAFANTPRRSDAYIICGVEEDKDRGLFTHIGVSEDHFPAPERISDLIHEYTLVKDVVVDARYHLEGKRTPYIAIPIQYEGPYVLLRECAGSGITPNTVFCRYGGSSTRATDRDLRRMTTDWGSWFLDCRYERSATSLIGALTAHFPRRRSLTDMGQFIRLIYDSLISDEFGKEEAPVLLHAYWGFDRIMPDAVERLASDNLQPTFRKSIVGARFDPNTLEAGATAGIRCILLDELYFVNDPYAQLCREYLKMWNDERSDRLRGIIVDLDFRVSQPPEGQEARKSILSFLEERIQSEGRTALVVHGDFGCGKTTTAKQFVADLSDEYLKGHSSVPKLLYIDVNNLDIRSRRDECIESQLLRYRLSRDHVDRLVTQVRSDEIHLVFDGVDEMARPYTAAGRHDAMEILKGAGNRGSAVYFVRTSYYPRLAEMADNLSPLADQDLRSGTKNLVIAQLLGLRQEQISDYLESRLGPEDVRNVRGALHKLGLASFLADPLIVWLVSDLVQRGGTAAIDLIPAKKHKAHFLSYLVEQLLNREQKKRQRHGVLADNFALFQRILQSVAFNMVCRGSSAIVASQLEGFIERVLESRENTAEVLDAFRTMSWMHCSSEGVLTFRHEALTLVCAAEHITWALDHRNGIALGDWQNEAPLAKVVCEYAGEIITPKGILGSTIMMGGDMQFNVRQLIDGVLDIARSRDNLGDLVGLQLDSTTIAAICKGASRSIVTARLPLRFLFSKLSPKQIIQVGVPLLWLMAASDSSEGATVAIDILNYFHKDARNFCEELADIQEDETSSLDVSLLKALGVRKTDLMNYSCYESLFKRIHSAETTDRKMRSYADRTLRAIEGRIARSKAAFATATRRR
jgi:hypothetical protein